MSRRKTYKGDTKQPKRIEFLILRELNSHYWMALKPLSKAVGRSKNDCRRLLDELAVREFVAHADAIVDGQPTWKLTAKGRAVLDTIQDWHQQDIWRRWTSAPPDITHLV